MEAPEPLPEPPATIPEPDVTPADLTPEEPGEQLEDEEVGDEPAVAEESVAEVEPYELPEGVTFVYDDGARIHLASVERWVTEANEQFLEIFGAEVTEATIFIFADIEGLQRAVTQFLNTRLEYLNLHGGTPAQAWPRSLGFYTAHQAPGDTLIIHELFHVLQHQLAHPDGSLLPLIPTWMAEGQADYATVVVREALGRPTSRAMYGDCRGQDTSLAELEDDHLASAQNSLRYCYGFNATELLVEGSGTDSIIEYWAMQGQGEPWKEAFHNTFGRTIEEFYDEFDEWNAEGPEMPDWITLPPSDDD